MTGSTYTAKSRGEIKHVVIVYPYTYVNPYQCFPALAAEYLQAGAVEAGRTTTLLDMRFEDDISEHLAKADLVCLYGFFEDCSIFGKWGIHVTEEVLAQVPEHTPVVAGGTGFGNPDATLKKYAGIDAVLVGVPNVPIQELLEAGTPDDIRNIAYRTTEGTIVNNPRTTHPLSDEVFPRRALRNPSYEYHIMGTPVDLVRAAIGCNYKCRFCYQFGKDTDGNFLRWQGRSPESQLAELSEIDAPFIMWVDDDMTTDMAALDRLADLMIERGMRKLMIGTGRVDHVIDSDVATLKKLERAGFFALAFGVESLHDETLRFYRKGQTVAMAEKAMRMLSQTNILLVCNFLLGSPGETEADMMEFLWFARRHDVDEIVTNRLRVPPGSILDRTVNDPATGQARPGMERIEGKPLKRIKGQIKYGQRTPWRLAMIFLKIHKHSGMVVHPLVVVCNAAESMTKHSWLGRSGIVKALVWLPKQVGSLRAFGWFTRGTALVLSPVVTAMTRIFDEMDRRFVVTPRVFPPFFEFLRGGFLKRQKERAQTVAGRPISGDRPEATLPTIDLAKERRKRAEALVRAKRAGNAS